jgi:hypothetical protein
MPPHSTTASSMLESLFGSKTDFLCTNGGSSSLGIGQHCGGHQFQGPVVPPLSCSQGAFDLDNECHQFQGAVGGPESCSQNVQQNLQQNVHHYQQTQPAVVKRECRRNVSFILHDRVREIPNVKDYSPEEISDLYMSRNEMNDIHEECWGLVDLMNSGIEYEDHDGFSKRGLVDLRDDSVERRRKMRDQAYQIVLGIQQFHADNRKAPNCMDMTEVTAGLYHKAAAQASEEAYEAAWFDAVAVRI